ncbi:MAG: molybdopterin-guanine dinucleotide biosynthesis protein B [Burkholderiaceae bacterium]|nr:molybdopterin-guanine dinucleotide biosynthesis protein B [Burkholderiaceae bacterium]
MKVIGFCGPSGVGKTTLVEQLIVALRQAGQRVSVIKHAHKRFDIDHPGKDSHRHREAGASEVLIASAHRLALLREFDTEGLPSVHQLIAELSPCDWLLVEGFKHADLHKVEVWRDALGQPPLYPHDPFVVAVATDYADRLPELTQRPVFALSAPQALASWLMDTGERYDYRPEMHVR